jgi:hypothetical protein
VSTLEAFSPESLLTRTFIVVSQYQDCRAILSDPGSRKAAQRRSCGFEMHCHIRCRTLGPFCTATIQRFKEAVRSSLSTFDISLGLINQLKAHGWSSPNCKPLTLLAHSLGGIVLKQAFVALANKIERDDPILKSMRGAVFFGVPNLGMEQKHLMAVVDGQPNRALIADLSPNSLYLQQLNVQFNGISFLQKSLLFWGYETKRSPTVAVSESLCTST